MEIYVAGTVLREREELKSPVYENLERIYHRIEGAAAESGHEVRLPYPDSELDQFSPEHYRAEIRRRILRSDSIITVLYPPNEAVAAEAHLAVKAGKPQAVVLDVLNPPKLSPELAVLKHYSAFDLPVEDVIEQLKVEVQKRRSMQKRRDEPPPMRA